MRVLAVDDFLRFRQFVRRILEEQKGFEVVGEASDGLEAVQKAEELQPDLILLDISLPKLNGIEAAKRIGKVAPKSKIVFLTVESSADVAREALRVGGRGYVLKAHAHEDLLAAVEAVLQDKQFVSASLADFTDPQDEHISVHPRSKQLVAPHVPRDAEVSRRHAVAFYPDDASFLRGVGRFVEAALKAGSAVIVIATEAHRISLLSTLQAQGLDMAAAIVQGRYTALDAGDALSTIMLSDTPDPVCFLEQLGNLIAIAAEAAQGGHVAVFGECVHLLWAQGNAKAAIQFEKLGNQLAKTRDVDILCGYFPTAIQGGMDANIFKRICAEHSVIHGLG